MRVFVALISFLVLAACADEAVRTYSFTPPASPGGRLCNSQCIEAQDYCQESCDLTYRRCATAVQTVAIRDYEKYAEEQFAAHAPIDFRPRDFERMQPCDEAKKTCSNSCGNHYQMCYQSCGGVVNVTTSCQFLCF